MNLGSGSRWTGFLLLLSLLIFPDAAPFQAEPRSDAGTDARRAIEQSLPYLERDGLAWMEGRIPIQGGEGCVSCHHVAFALWSHREAQRAGIAIQRGRIESLAKTAEDFLSNDSKGRTVSWGQLILGREPEEVGKRIRDPWPSFQSSIVDAQLADGRWQAKGQFPRQNRSPIESDAVATMWTILALSSFDEIGDSIEGSRARAAAWLEASEEGASNEWLLSRLLVEHALGSPEVAQGLMKELLGQQHPNGGWSWKREDPSNAYSTGQTLYALRVAGLDAQAPAIRQGVDYLLKTQRNDGAWFVPSELTSAEGTDEKDYIYTYWGTAWASMGLARTLTREAPTPLVKKRWYPFLTRW